MFPRTRKITFNEDLYLIDMAIELLVDNDKGLLNLYTRLRASDGTLMDLVTDSLIIV